MFSINQSLFLKKTKPLYSYSKYLFGIGIWIWAAKNKGFSHRVQAWSTVYTSILHDLCMLLTEIPVLHNHLLPKICIKYSKHYFFTTKNIFPPYALAQMLQCAEALFFLNFFVPEKIKKNNQK